MASTDLNISSMKNTPHFPPHACRGCSFESPHNQPLFRSSSDDDATTADDSAHDRNATTTPNGDLFASCIRMPITPTDGYPARICDQCVAVLRVYAEFQKSVLRVHEHYTSVLMTAAVRPVTDDEAAVVDTNNRIETDDKNVMLLDDSELWLSTVDDEEATATTTKAVTVLRSDEHDDFEGEPTEETYLDEVYLNDDEDDDDADDDDDATPVIHPASVDDDDDSEAANTRVSSPKTTITDDGVPLPSTQPSLSASSKPTAAAAVGRLQHVRRTKPHRCAECRSRFACERALRLHRCAVGKVTYACPQCAKTFRSLAAVDEHALRHTEHRRFGCDRCDRFYKTPIDLHLHRRVHASAAELPRKYRCEQCEYSTQNRTHLVHHLNGHAGVRPFACPQCDKRFRRKELVREHQLAKHAEAAAQRFVCAVCDATFGLAYRLTRHMAIHSRQLHYESVANEKMGLQ